LSSTRSKDALAIAKELRLNAEDDERKISTLLMGCKKVCRYMGNLDENTWIDQELDGYDSKSMYDKENKTIPKYRKVRCLFYYQNDILVRFQTSKQNEMYSTFNIPIGITELETIKDDMVITGGPILDVINQSNLKGQPLIVKAIVPDNYIHKVLTGIRNQIHEFCLK
jgi:hypothetical protein